MQLDLFLDGNDVRLRNDAADALRRRDACALRTAIEHLRSEYPDDYSLADLDGVLIALATLDPAADSAQAIADRVDFIEGTLHRLIERLLGARAAMPWIAAEFLRLATMALAHPFRREYARAHAARLFLLAGDLRSARVATEAIASWRKIPEPLAWMTEIAWRENHPEEYWPLSVELSWIAPPVFGSTLQRAAPEAVRSLYRSFLAEADLDNESADESADEPGESVHEAAWFPAWLLVEHSELLDHFRPVDPHPSRPARSVALLICLLVGERNGVSPVIVEQRMRLRSLAPRLFDRYLALR